MNTNRPVLATTDGSEHSYRVLPHAARLADALGSQVALLSVVEPDDRDKTEAQLRETLARLGLTVEALTTATNEGEHVAGAILRTARESDATVIALDSRGHGALRHMLHGSVAHDLLRQTDRPLLISGPNSGEATGASGSYRIVITNDGSPASEAILHALAPLLTQGRFDVTLLRIHEHAPGGEDENAALAASESELAQARRLLPESLSVTTLVRTIPLGAGVDTAIIEKARELGAHAIAFSTHGVSARRHVILGSMATLLLGRSSLPLIVARAL